VQIGGELDVPPADGAWTTYTEADGQPLRGGTGGTVWLAGYGQRRDAEKS